MDSIHSKDNVPIWASISKSDSSLTKGEKPQLMHPSTRRKCAAAQVYFLDYYYDLLNYLYERKNRLKTFIKFVEDEKLKQDEEEKEWTRHCGRERAYLRKRRVRIRLEQFHVLFQIGQGGYGQVFLATKKDTQEVCALKQMNKRTLHKYDEIGHILNERDVLTASKGEWLVKLLYAFQDVDHVYLAMEFVPGGDMRTLLNSNGMLLDCHARFYIAEMVTAVDALHQLGYIHRDLKPENFLIDGSGHVKLADFGLSKGSLSSKRVASLRKRLDSIKHKQLTHLKASEKRTFHDSMRKGDYIWHFSVVGSPEYMAPEILEGAEKDGGSPYDHKVDYWSLGCILYEYLAGFPPFTSPNPDEVWLNLYRWQEVLERPIFEDQTLNDNFTDLAWDLIKHMLAHADSRYASLDKFKSHPYFKEIPWHNLRNSEPPFVPQLESETDPSYFDDFSKADTIQQIYASIERRDLQRHSPIADDGVSSKSSSSDPLNTPLRAAFVGFTYRHKARHFTPPSSSAPKVAPYLNTLL